VILDRRSFLKAAVALPLLPPLQSDQLRIGPLGLQLYTVRSEIQKNFEGALARVAAIGYKEVEFAGYFGRSPREVQAILKTNGLAGMSAHFSFASLGDQWPRIVDDARVMGHQYLVIVTIDEASRAEPGIWQRASERFNRAGEVCRAAGIKLAYHNHLFEFAATGTTKRPYEILLESTDPSLVSMQMDLCWVTAAGQDPADYFRRYPGRFSSVHVKDLKRLPAQPAVKGEVASRDVVLPDLADVGHGIIGWTNVLAKARSAGVRHYFVEHDAATAPFDSVERSFRYLNAMRFTETAR